MLLIFTARWSYRQSYCACDLEHAGGYSGYLYLEAIHAGPISPVPASGAVRCALKLLHAIVPDLAGSTARAAGRLFGLCSRDPHQLAALSSLLGLRSSLCRTVPRCLILHFSTPPARRLVIPGAFRSYLLPLLTSLARSSSSRSALAGSPAPSAACSSSSTQWIALLLTVARRRLAGWAHQAFLATAFLATEQTLSAQRYRRLLPARFRPEWRQKARSSWNLC